MIQEIIRFLATSKWTYIAYWLPLIIFIVVFSIKNKDTAIKWFLATVAWAKESVESGKQANAERLTAAAVVIFCIIPGHISFVAKCDNTEHLLYLFVIDFVFILVLYKIITPTQLLELKGIVRDKKEPKSEQNTEHN